MTGPIVKLNPRVVGLKPSATLEINERSNELINQGVKVFKFGLGQSPFPVPGCVVDELRNNAAAKDYLQVQGLYDLRDKYAQHLNKAHATATEYEASDIMVGPGSKELLFVAQMAYDADLLLPNPSWVSYEPQAKLCGKRVFWLETTFKDRWVLQPGILEEHCKLHPDTAKFLVLNYPSNPTGCTHRPDELKALAVVARRFGVMIISDEIYGLVDHDGQHVSIAEYYPEGTIISSGLSKWCGAGGWRLGLWAFPKNLHWLLDAIKVIASETFTSVAAPIQLAAKRAYKEDCPEIREYLVKSRRILKLVGEYVWQELNQVGVMVHRPEGGFYLFPDFEPFRASLVKRGITTSRQLTEALLTDTGVATLPGSDFGRPDQDLVLRLAYVNFDGTVALADQTESIQYFAPLVVEATSSLVSWVTKFFFNSD